MGLPETGRAYGGDAMRRRAYGFGFGAELLLRYVTVTLRLRNYVTLRSGQAAIISTQ